MWARQRNNLDMIMFYNMVYSGNMWGIGMRIIINGKILCGVLVVFLLPGCIKTVPTFLEGSLKTVPIYKRGNLAKPEMGWDPDPMEAAIQKHIYFAKEASSGGAEAAGGGCGCN